MQRFDFRVTNSVLKITTVLLVFIFAVSACGPRWEIMDPYGDVNWETHIQYKANFHTHTTNSDGRLNPHIGRNWNMLILPELNHEQVRLGMENGLSYFIFAPGGHDGPLPPVIEAVKVNSRRGTIEITATGYNSVLWKTGGKVVYEVYNKH